MASVAQIEANRSNAQKSTGPRTPEGKARASQNAVKHGLLAEQVVIHGEDPAQFELYREGMLADLAPVGGIEMMLAERAVSLAWRLRRAERLHSAVFATVYRENAGDIVLWPKHGLPIEPKPDEEAVILGQVVMTDFARAQVLDRLLVHERRIENSLYRTMRELRKEREARTAAGPEPSLGEEPRSNATEGTEGHREEPGMEGKNAATCGPLVCSPASCPSASVPSVAKTPLLCSDRQTGPEAELASFDADSTGFCPGGSDKRSPRSLSMAPSQGQDHRQTSLSLPPGVEEGPFSTLHDRSCETNPIPTAVSSDGFDFALHA
ncbi:MAG TPA: hypothetical protein VLI39_21800 [Sedimentisphaerales bacterium]|nr:hypothetical protein [Sedimentisphaerales bacterium]